MLLMGAANTPLSRHSVELFAGIEINLLKRGFECDCLPDRRFALGSPIGHSEETCSGGAQCDLGPRIMQFKGADVAL